LGEGASQSSASSPACGRSVGLRGGRASRLHGGGFSRGAPLCATRPLLGASVEVSNLWHRGPFLSARCRSCGWLAGCVCVALRCSGVSQSQCSVCVVFRIYEYVRCVCYLWLEETGPTGNDRSTRNLVGMCEGDPQRFPTVACDHRSQAVHRERRSWSGTRPASRHHAVPDGTTRITDILPAEHVSLIQPYPSEV